MLKGSRGTQADIKGCFKVLKGVAVRYAWVIEFQCGTRPNLPKDLCVGHTATDGQCYFTGGCTAALHGAVRVL